MPYPPNLAHPLVRDMAAWWLADPDLAAGNVWYDVLREKNGGFANGALVNASQGDGFTVINSRKGGFASYQTNGGHVTINPKGFPSGGSAMTIACWFKDGALRNVDSEPFSMGNNAGNGVRIGFDVYSPANVISIDCANCGIETAYTVDYKWHHIAGVVPFDGASIADLLLYFDGQTVPISYVQGDTKLNVSANANCFIGEAAYEGGQFYGNVDDVQIHRRAISAVEISQLYTESLNGYPNMLWRPKKRFFYGLGVSPPSTIVQRRMPGVTRVGSRRAG